MNRKLTSQRQFELMVSFMETHGDLSKSTVGQGKTQLWAELAQVLNSDGFGEEKTEEKWRKVWADLKSNINRKAARLQKDFKTSGVPAYQASLSNIEQRVLAIRSQSATGTELVTEHSTTKWLDQLQPRSEPSDSNLETPQCLQAPVEVLHLAVSSPEIHNQETEDIFARWQPELKAERSTPENSLPETSGSSPSPSPPRRRRSRSPSLSRSGQTRKRIRTDPKDNRATEHFLRSGFEHRKKQERREDERQRRAEQMEIRWQKLFDRLVTVVEKVADKFCRD